MIDFADILADLELKRAAALPRAERPAIDVSAAEAMEMPAVELGDGPLTAAHVAGIVADALAALALAHGETEANTAAARGIVAATTAAVARRLHGARRVTEHDLSSIVEAVLIDAGHFDVARALVLDRAPAPAAAAPGAPRLIRRSGDVAAWDPGKIETAIRSAFLSLEADPAPAAALAARVDERARGLGLLYVPIETVQDIVQEELVLGGHMRVAERYIVYRAERALLRAREERPAAPAAEADDLRRRIAFASIGLDLDMDADELAQELRRSTHAGMHDADLRRLVVLNAKALVERDSELSRFAGRILLSYLYEETIGWDVRRDDVAGLRGAHARALRPMLEHGAAIGRIDPRLLEYDLDTLAAALDPSADLDFDFLGLQTLYDRYLICDKTGEEPRRIEAPQLFWMRVAMGVCLAEPEEERTQRAIALYGMYKARRFCSSTPTLFNAGTNHPQLSSCYLYYISDTLSSIVERGIAENAMCSKWAGGLGGSWTAVRGTGSHIESTNGSSQGVVPFLKMHNDQLVAVNQGGKRAGSGCAYLEVWHNDIREFLELRRNTGDERRRTHDMNTACWVPDLFMQRVEARGRWTLFRSSDVPDLHDLYGREFAARYEHYEARVAAGEMHGEVIPALELWKQMLRMLFETGHPWITFKDPCNVRSPQDHAGVVHSSNLCTEITLNTGPDETAVCNLGSIVLDQHLAPDGSLDHARLRETVRVAVRALDDVIDANFHPTEPARTANMRHRPIGLGVMGLQYALYAKGLPFDSEEALRFGDEAMEAIAYYAYEASSDLAAERGRYASYAGSKWDRGLLPPDTVDLLEAERGEPVVVPRGGTLDWEALRERIARQGMRNSNVLAVAPTATIANIMGTSPCIEPMYKNVFAKSNLSGDFLVLNPHLVADLKAAGLWSREMARRLKEVDGDLELLGGVPAELVERYRTAFGIDPHRLIDAAARRAKWIDQSQSLNLFLARPDLKAMSHMYRHAWRSGLKTTYYLRTLGASRVEGPTVSRAAAVACSIEAARNGEECEACQ
jgi:ribonucleoside-diphosphate reductase alpha chain